MSFLDDLFGVKKDWTIPVSIIVGSIIIAISICVSANKLSSGRFLGDTSSIAVGQNNLPSNQGPVEISERRDAPKIGSGKVTIVEFADFQCPFCQQFFNESYKALKQKYVDTGKVTFVYRHFPLSFHQNAQKAAEAAECASRQGKFSEYHDMLFKESKPDGVGLYPADLKLYSEIVGLDKNKFNKCLDNGEATEAVTEDMKAGTQAGVTGTPTFFVDGQMIVGAQRINVFEQAIEEALNQ